MAANNSAAAENGKKLSLGFKGVAEETKLGLGILATFGLSAVFALNMTGIPAPTFGLESLAL